MKRTDTRTTAIAIGALVAGWFLGASGIASSQANEVTPAPVVQGEIIKVCISLKSGAIRAASKCDSKTERKTVLGGTGAQGPIGVQGEKGDTGSQGIQGVKGDTGSQGVQGAQGIQGEKGVQGLQGFTGLTGATGTVSGLNTKRIDFLSGPYSLCNGLGTSASVVGNVSVGFSGSLSVSKTTLQGCTVTVYVP
jgi:hypothetical protein